MQRILTSYDKASPKSSNFQTVSIRLRQSGMTNVGARQAAMGQPVTNATDRARLAELIALNFASSAGGSPNV